MFKPVFEKTYTVNYYLSEKGQKAAILAGLDGKKEQIASAPVTPEALEVCTVYNDGTVSLTLDWAAVPGKMKVNTFGEPQIDYGYSDIFFDRPMTAAELVAWEIARRAAVKAREAELQPELEAAKAEYDALQAERAEQKAAKEKARADREAQEKAAREARETDKLAWITAHGSDYLKDAVSLGYNCQRQYVTERAALEFPDFAVDFDDRASWNDRACPSPEALKEVKTLIAAGHDAQVVWLTQGPDLGDVDDDYDQEEFEPCEAIVIRDYLGKYDLVKF